MDTANEQDIRYLDSVDFHGHFMSMGLHPYSLGTMPIHDSVERIRSHAQELVAIGECGLDSTIGIDMAEQIRSFVIQAELAEELRKPLIIHCVRSHEQILQVHRMMKPSIPWIIHGFNRTYSIARVLQEHGLILSIGRELLTENHHMRTSFQEIVQFPFFLETDGKEITIEAMYSEASALLTMKTEHITSLIEQHFQNVYGTNITHSPTLE